MNSSVASVDKGSEAIITCTYKVKKEQIRKCPIFGTATDELEDIVN